MITIIGGNPGTGKTMFLVYLAVQKLMDSYSDYRNSTKEIMALKNGGFSNLEIPPQRHLVHCDIPINFTRRLTPYICNGFEIGLPNMFFNTRVFPPYSIIFIDEAQRYYDSRMSKFLRPEVYKWYQIHRHNNYNVYMVCQRIANIDLNIRGIAEKFIVIDSLEFKHNEFGQIIKTIWKTREFNSLEVAEAYQVSKDKKENSNLGKVAKYETDLPIYKFYDTHGCKPLFYANAGNQKFDYYNEDGYMYTLDSIIEYSQNHTFCAPQGFWKNDDYDKKIIKKNGGLVYG